MKLSYISRHGFNNSHSDIRKTKKYVLTATGFPMLTTFIIFMLHKFNAIEELIMQRNVCFVNIDKPFVTWTFILGPLMLLVVYNLSLFIMTMYQIHRTKRQTKIAVKSLDEKNSVRRSLRMYNHESIMFTFIFWLSMCLFDRFKTFFKLFLLMGIESFWFVEIFAEFTIRQQRTTEDKDGEDPDWFHILSAFNCYHGVIHFYMFVMTPKFFAMIKKSLSKKSSPLNLKFDCQIDGKLGTNTYEMTETTSSKE